MVRLPEGRPAVAETFLGAASEQKPKGSGRASSAAGVGGVGRAFRTRVVSGAAICLWEAEFFCGWEWEAMGGFWAVTCSDFYFRRKTGCWRIFRGQQEEAGKVGRLPCWPRSREHEASSQAEDHGVPRSSWIWVMFCAFIQCTCTSFHTSLPWSGREGLSSQFYRDTDRGKGIC